MTDSRPGFAETVLNPAQRIALAADESVGGGNLLRSALAASPSPKTPFVHSTRPITNLEGVEQYDYSLLEIDQLAQSWSAWYLERGVQPKDRVAVWFEDSFAYSVHFYALAQIGAIAVLINSKATPAIAESLLEQTAPVGLYADRARLDGLTANSAILDALEWTEAEETLPAPPAAELPESAYWQHVDEDPVVILHSSGTTGRPKPTIHTHKTIVAGPQFRLVDFKENPGALMLTALPQSHLGCIAFTVYAVLAGTPVVAHSDRSGADLAATVAAHRPTAVMAFAHSYAELASLDNADGALDSVNSWVSIGDAVHQAHINKVLSLRSAELPSAQFFDRLGTTELGWGVLLKIRTRDSERNDRCAGQPVGVAEVAILRKDGSHADIDEVGFLAARGPAITPGYWGDSATTYRYKLAGHWLPGDMAYKDANGDFFLVDRAADQIQTATGPAYSVLMEEVLLSDVPAFEDVAVVAGSEAGEIVPVAVVTTKEGAEDVGKLLARANEALEAAGHPALRLLEVAADESDFPVGVTGKVLKRKLREKYADLGAYLQDGAGKTLAAAG
ncbi:class I adenylate-forming enzyme family protein [Streptomyces sp. G-G2]|uniref:class I adenylate-forming enzyme family protein n=1 Tax=Streptomyces sp. G-G2 TaxID=3046201 RepID=UPI0024B9FF3B|nr:class I adenylate-forming enzyme family protein [Streptomyces sp. G-G2]MDJ0382921.1 class I adenylate-forming enzyme family protein [Streptomyces sp. G-G2]